MEEYEGIFLPTLHYFENNNRFSGSFGLSVQMKTPKEVDLEASSIHGQLWHGPYCLEKSTVEAEETFPMSHEGLEAMHRWLVDHLEPPAEEA